MRSRGNEPPTGFAVDVLTALAKDLRLRLEFVESSREALFDQVRSCSIDIGISSHPSSSELEKKFDLTHSYLQTSAVVVEIGGTGVTAGAGEQPARSGGWNWTRLLLVLGLAGAALGLLALLVTVLNHTLFWRRQATGARTLFVVNVDAMVSGPSSSLRWLWASQSGRVVAALWLLMALLLGIPWLTNDPVHGGLTRAWSYDDLRARLEQEPGGFSGLSAISQRALSCGGPRPCLEALARGRLRFVAGNRETLCSEAASLGLANLVIAGALEVQRYSFLLPPGSSVREALNRDLLDSAKRSAILKRYRFEASDRAGATCGEPVVGP